jgi:hypothetical protein
VLIRLAYLFVVRVLGWLMLLARSRISGQRCLSRRMTAAIRIVPSTALRMAGPRCWSGYGR